MKLFALDLHIGIRDLQYTFEKLGHRLDIWSISGHHRIMGWERANVDVVNHRSWRGLNKEKCDAFYKRYKEELKDYDGFVTFYPPSFSMLYERFEKPIIMVVPIRYDVPFENDCQALENFNIYLKEGIDQNKIIPIVNNKYDQAYLELFVNRKFELIPSICDYTNANYTGIDERFLYFSKVKSFLNFIKNPNVIDKKTLNNYSWQNMVDYRAAIHLPYSNTIMSLFEQYTANIPLLFPTKSFLIRLWKNYWDSGVMSECSWRQLGNYSPNSIVKTDIDKILDPNNYTSVESFKYWSRKSDFYDEENMPFIQYYDNVAELEFKLETLKYNEISQKMSIFNSEIRIPHIIKSWENVFKKI